MHVRIDILNQSRKLRDKDDDSEFRLSPCPETGTRWHRVSEPRTRFFARSDPGSNSPACVRPVVARALFPSRAAAGHGDPELHSFRRILRRPQNI